MKVIGVTGGKGGTGKSTLATALAVELAKQNKVLLVDADVECPNDHLLLGINRKEAGDVNQRVPSFDFKGDYSGISDVCETKAIITINNKEPIFIPSQCNGCGACMIAYPKIVKKWDKKQVGKIFQ